MELAKYTQVEVEDTPVAVAALVTTQKDELNLIFTISSTVVSRTIGQRNVRSARTNQHYPRKAFLAVRVGKHPSKAH